LVERWTSTADVPGNRACLEPIWPRLAALNLNTLIASLSWELVEPEEGKFDFSLADGIIEAARQHHLKLVFIWFATWKNGDGAYVPAWVKTNWTRFPRCQHRPGVNTTQLTALSGENVKADGKAFAAVMRHLRQVDGKQHTVLMMQAENESGVMPVSRDHCPLAEAAFAKPVPNELMAWLVAHKEGLIPDLKEVWARTNFREACEPQVAKDALVLGECGRLKRFRHERVVAPAQPEDKPVEGARLHRRKLIAHLGGARHVPPVFDELFVRPRERCCCVQRGRCNDHAEDQDGDPGAPVFLRPPRRRRASDS